MEGRKTMFSKILVATDLTEASERVICTLGGLSALGVREVLLVHCFNIRDVGTLGNEIIELARPSFDRQKDTLAKLGFRTEGMMVLGLPHVEINRIARRNDCSLIVVGSQSRTMAGELLLGGTAGAVIHSASLPVLILYLRMRCETGCTEAECRPLEHVLFPTDFSDNAERAFSYVKQLAKQGSGRITLFHVQDRSRIDPHLADRLEEFNRIDTGRMERLKAELEGEGAAEVDIELTYGSPKLDILARTMRGDISLTVMGSQGRGYIGELFLGSVSYFVSRRTDVPLLLVPARD
jgi:nucleotide-binding universal stress UspA family protein